MDALVSELRSHYGEDAVAVRTVESAITLVRVAGIRIPKRNPAVFTDVLVELRPDFRKTDARPATYVRPGTVQPNGRPGKNVTAVQFHGESWLQFSWRMAWKSTDPGWALIEGAVRRFSINED